MTVADQTTELDTPLFRKEVLASRAERLHGDVHIAVPVSWQAIGYLLAIGLVVAFAYLANATYSRMELAAGIIALDRGVAPVIPSRAGTIVSINVREAQRVEAGAPLAEIRAEDTLPNGRRNSDELLAAVDAQDSDLRRQSEETLAAAGAARSRIDAQIAGLQQEISSLDQQIRLQRQLVATATSEVEVVEGVARRGFVSRRDVLNREETLMTRRQHLAQLQQLRAQKDSALSEARRAIAQTLAEARAKEAGISTSMSALMSQRANIQTGRGYVIAAPVSGTVTAITARVGQAATSQQALMIIVPDGGVARAELYIPTRAAGFLETGQRVKLSVDAFPHERFGLLDGRIESVSGVTVMKSNGVGEPTPVFLVSAVLDQPWVMAFGRRHNILPGMALSARIVTREQSLLEWLFEPLFSVTAQ